MILIIDLPNVARDADLLLLLLQSLSETSGNQRPQPQRNSGHPQKLSSRQLLVVDLLIIIDLPTVARDADLLLLLPASRKSAHRSRNATPVTPQNYHPDNS